ncbi:adenylyl-sulfate kinase [Streptomyces albogriseolus]|uniref:adenylyl-sulfate kinase n=1 Tax=Streptomyces albogriseolus TaxID=1887 RepID=UPI00368B6F66
MCTCWPGATVWLTGRPGAGQSDLARALAERLGARARRVEVLDGDRFRSPLPADPDPAPDVGRGVGRAGRDADVRRLGLMAEVLARNGVIAVVPVTAPRAADREAVRRRHESSGTPYVEIDVAHAAGVGTGGDPYEAPASPDLRVETDTRGVRECARTLHALLTERGLA